MAKLNYIELTKDDRFEILYEDRSVLAIDKPAGWMLVPVSWQKTDRNLQAAILSSIAAGHFWARSRNLKFLKYVHRLDAETSGILLFAKSVGALHSVGDLFETRKMEKIYLAVTNQAPQTQTWNCRLKIGADPKEFGRMRIDPNGKAAETEFRVITSRRGKYLIEARPCTGRTHQIRLHLAASGCAIVGDELYGRSGAGAMGLRAVGLAYKDPFTAKAVAIRAPFDDFIASHGFESGSYRWVFQSLQPHNS